MPRKTLERYPNSWWVKLKNEDKEIDIDFDKFEWREQRVEVFVRIVPKVLLNRDCC